MEIITFIRNPFCGSESFFCKKQQNFNNKKTKYDMLDMDVRRVSDVKNTE